MLPQPAINDLLAITAQVRQVRHREASNECLPQSGKQFCRNIDSKRQRDIPHAPVEQQDASEHVAFSPEGVSVSVEHNHQRSN